MTVVSPTIGDPTAVSPAGTVTVAELIVSATSASHADQSQL
ncbi:hypothetical protein ACFY71_14085 [Streptomyces cinerochromogenes]